MAYGITILPVCLRTPKTPQNVWNPEPFFMKVGMYIMASKTCQWLTS
jgi:hypothetical protein